jgi:hypothetical protein
MSKTIRNTPPRNSLKLAVAMGQFSRGGAKMTDRRAPKNGGRNVQRDLLDEYREESDNRPTLIPQGE